MPKKFRPITPSQRGLVLNSTSDITSPHEIKSNGKKRRIKPQKNLVFTKKSTGGRNHHGHITCRHKGGGHKRFYREVDFVREKEGVSAKVNSIEYDPNRTAFIALLNYADGEKRYILAPQGLKKGDTVMTSDNPPYDVGCCMKLKYMPLGSTVHNIELRPGKGGQLVRSAGLGAQLMARSEGYATIKMPSGEVRLINEECRATFGSVSNPERNLRMEGKAGRSRWKGIRPTVRGIVMNPVDHPQGGGEGKSKGNIPQSPWGIPSKGFKTRSNRKNRRWLVKDRRA